ncbi:MAG: hypothetical protein K2G89_06385 [Lachnospiraceae bacterium]|nr:hypothetical protein [Lachnospiraceae bacterium]
MQKRGKEYAAGLTWKGFDAILNAIKNIKNFERPYRYMTKKKYNKLLFILALCSLGLLCGGCQKKDAAEYVQTTEGEFHEKTGA